MDWRDPLTPYERVLVRLGRFYRRVTGADRRPPRPPYPWSGYPLPWPPLVVVADTNALARSCLHIAHGRGVSHLTEMVRTKRAPVFVASHVSRGGC